MTWIITDDKLKWNQVDCMDLGRVRTLDEIKKMFSRFVFSVSIEKPKRTLETMVNGNQRKPIYEMDGLMDLTRWIAWKTDTGINSFSSRTKKSQFVGKISEFGLAKQEIKCRIGNIKLVTFKIIQ